MGKLVRDKIPDIIRASGRTPTSVLSTVVARCHRTPVATTLHTDAYRTALTDKLRNEVAELIAAKDAHAHIEEAADIVEVLAAIAAEYGATIDDIVDVARRKRATRGGFDLRLWLNGVDRG